MLAREDAEEKYGGTKFVCKYAPQKYAIGVKLLKDGENFCVDSSGVAQVTEALPSSTACPL